MRDTQDITDDGSGKKERGRVGKEGDDNESEK
jgi:hypothetical protein